MHSHKKIQSIVPAKLMLAGEYSVLSGHPCLAITLDHYLKATVEIANEIQITSNFYDKPIHFKTNDLDLFSSNEVLKSTLEFVIQKFKLPGLKINVDSELRPHYGFGSSSAIRLAILSALARILANVELEIPESAHLIQQKQQGSGSGYDVFTQFYGGLVRYFNPQNFEISKQFPESHQLYLFVKDDQTPQQTTKIMNSTLKELKQNDKIEILHECNNILVNAFCNYLLKTNSKNTQNLLDAMKNQRAVFAETSLYPQIAKALEKQPGCDDVWSFKTTGAGGEDALIFCAPEKSSLSDVSLLLEQNHWKQVRMNFIQDGLTTRELF